MTYDKIMAWQIPYIKQQLVSVCSSNQPFITEENSRPNIWTTGGKYFFFPFEFRIFHKKKFYLEILIYAVTASVVLALTS